jgi:phospholipase/carboxylesterase
VNRSSRRCRCTDTAVSLIVSLLVATPVVAGAESPPAHLHEKPEVTVGILGGVKFFETVTADAKASSRLPLVIALHPQGGSPEEFLSFFGGLKSKARIIAPAADEKNGLWSWYRGNSTDDGAPGPRRAAKRLKPFLAELLAARPIAGRPIVVGYSQGAIIALTLAVTESSRLGTVVAISGRLPPALVPDVRRAVPGPMVEAFHGKLDHAVPYAACQKSITMFKAAGFVASLTSYDDSGHEITRQEAQQVWTAVDRAVDAAGAGRGAGQPHPDAP